MTRMVYMKDFRSNVCFAMVDYDLSGIDPKSLTFVPCTPAVEALLINKREEPREKPCANQCPKNAPLLPEKMEQK